MKYQLTIKAYQGKIHKGAQGCKFEANTDAEALQRFNAYKATAIAFKPITHLIITLRRYDCCAGSEIGYAVVRSKKC